jgi:signal transduction histidine kinase
MPALNIWVRRVEWLVLLLVGMELVFSAGKWATLAQYYGPYVDIGILFVASVVLLVWLSRDRHMLTRFFIAGSIVALAGSAIGMFWTYFLPQFEYLRFMSPVTITKTGVMFEAIIFNTGLLFKARQLEKEKFATQQKLMEEREAKRRIERKQQAERDRLAADLHDDIGATLSGIGISSDALQKQIEQGQTESARRLAKAISDDARASISGMSDIVWAIKPQNDSFEKLLGRMRGIALNLLAAQGVRVEFEVSGPVPNGAVEVALRRNLFLVFKEALNNCAKYAGAKRVDIRFSFGAGFVEMEIGDDGQGFDEAKLSRVNGLRNMRARADEMHASWQVDSAPGKGTRIFLRIPFESASR